MLKQLNLIRGELLKFKRKPFLYLMLAPAFALPLFVVLYYLFLGGNGQINNFVDFCEWSAISYTAWIILPVVLGVTGTMMLSSETSNDTLKQLWIIPVSRTGFLCAKVAVLLLFSIAYMLITSVLTLAGGVALSFSDVNLSTFVFLLQKCLQIGILTPFALLPILLIATLKKGFVLPVCVTLVYTFLGFIMLNFAMQFHPLSCVTAIVVYGMQGVAPAVPINTITCYVNLTIFSVISIVTTVFILRRQSC